MVLGHLHAIGPAIEPRYGTRSAGTTSESDSSTRTPLRHHRGMSSTSEPGARDVSARFRGTGRLVEWEGCSYLLPTIIHCEDAAHPLANREFLFPFATVVKVNQDQIPESLGPSLVVTAITNDPKLVQKLVASPNVDRLNLGAVPTNHVSWDQPHEGNLFEHLYARRAFQRAASA